MSNPSADVPSEALQRQEALSRWDSDGGREPIGSVGGTAMSESTAEVPPLSDAELVNMRVRIIALENLLIALLVKASSAEIELAYEMAGYISPREGFTPHPLTIKAASHMKDLMDRASGFRSRAT